MKASLNALLGWRKPMGCTEGSRPLSFAVAEPSWAKRSWRDCRPGSRSCLFRAARTVTVHPRTRTATVNPVTDITGSQSLVSSGSCSCRAFFAIPALINSVDGLPDGTAPQPLRGRRDGMARRPQGKTGETPVLVELLDPLRFVLLHSRVRSCAPSRFRSGFGTVARRRFSNALSAPFQLPGGFARACRLARGRHLVFRSACSPTGPQGPCGRSVFGTKSPVASAPRRKPGASRAATRAPGCGCGGGGRPVSRTGPTGDRPDVLPAGSRAPSPSRGRAAGAFAPQTWRFSVRQALAARL